MVLFQMENGSPDKFSLICLPLLIVQTEVIHLQTD
jgi:hypothetical protein